MSTSHGFLAAPLRLSVLAVALATLTSLAACGDNSGSSVGGRVTYSVQGTISGLVADGLKLDLTSGGTLVNEIQVAADASAFQFAAGLADGQPWQVSVQSPSSENCSVTSNTQGTINGQSVTGVAVTCKAILYPLTANITVLPAGTPLGQGLVLNDTDNDHLVQVPAGAVPSGGLNVQITPGIASGTNYSVVVNSTPLTGPSQTCQVTSSGSGVAPSTVPIGITCKTLAYSLGGTVTGLASATTALQLTDTVSGNTATVTGNGPFSLGSVNSGSNYNIVVSQQPQHLNQTCSVQGGNTTTTSNPAPPVGDQAVTTVTVSCTTNLYGVSGVVQGLDSNTSSYNLVVYDSVNGGVTTVQNSGTFTIPYTNCNGQGQCGIPDGSSYSIWVTEPAAASLPPLYMYCGVKAAGAKVTIGGANITSTAPSGVIAGGPVTNVVIECRPPDPGLLITTSNLLLEVYRASNYGGLTSLAETPISSPAGTILASGMVLTSARTEPGISAEISYLFMGSFSASVSGSSISSSSVVWLPSGDPGATPQPYLLQVGVGEHQTFPSAVTNGAQLTLDPSQQYVYELGDRLAGFSIDYTSGNLTQVGNTSAPNGDSFNGDLVFTPDGKFAYATTLEGNVCEFSVTNGVISPLGSGVCTADSELNLLYPAISPLAISSDGTHAYVSTIGVAPIGDRQPITPVVDVLNIGSNGSLTIAGEVTDQAVHNVGIPVFSPMVIQGQYLIRANQDSNSLSVFDIQTDGSLTVDQQSPYSAAAAGGLFTMSVDPSGKFLYVAGYETGNVVGFKVNAPGSAASALSLIGAYPAGFTSIDINSPNYYYGGSHLAIDSSGSLLYVTGATVAGSGVSGFFAGEGVSAFYIDPNTGALTLAAGSPFLYSTGQLSQGMVTVPYSKVN